jgi:glycosyltransferase involved in cell wall biosynthesis
LTIVYDATPLLLRSAGVKNYHHALLLRLLPGLRPHRVELFPFLSGLGCNRNESSNYGRPATLARLGALLAANYLRVPLGPWACRRADLFHVTPHLFHPPAGGPVRLTSFVHDPTCVLLPQFHTASNVRYFRHFAESVLPRLHGVIVPSEAVKRDLAERLRLREEKVAVVPHGVDPVFFAPAAPEPGRHDLPEKYVLFVGAMEPRKNLGTLLAAYRMLPEELRREHPLIIAGTSGWKAKELRRRLGAGGGLGVRAIGYVPPETLPAVYARASVFVFPSLYEGFGMPLLEAMAAGAPVVTSNVSALPEVAGEAALTVDPRSPSELARAIERVLTDRVLASRLSAMGVERARQFTWEKTASLTRDFFERVAGR